MRGALTSAGYCTFNIEGGAIKIQCYGIDATNMCVHVQRLQVGSNWKSQNEEGKSISQNGEN